MWMSYTSYAVWKWVHVEMLAFVTEVFMDNVVKCQGLLVLGKADSSKGKLLSFCTLKCIFIFFTCCLFLTILTFYVYYLMWLYIQTLSQAIVKVVIPTERYMFFLFFKLVYKLSKEKKHPTIKLRAWSVDHCMLQGAGQCGWAMVEARVYYFCTFI